MDRKALLKELEFLTGLLEKHEASKKEGKKSPDQQKCGNLLPQKFINQPANPPYNYVKSSQSTSFDKKYSLIKSNSIPNQRTVLHKNFKAKNELSTNQTLKCIPSVVKEDSKRIVLNRKKLLIPKRTVLCSENNFDKTSTVLFDKSGKMHSHTQFMEELESLTKLLKKKNSENKLLNSTAKNESNIQKKQLVYTDSKNINYDTSNKYNSLKYGSNFSKTKCQNDFPRTVIHGNISPSLSNMKLSTNCYSKLNSNDKSKHSNNVSLLKHFNQNKYSYKKVDSRSLNSKINSVPLNTVGKKAENQFKKTLGSHVRKVMYLDSKKFQGNLCLPSNSPVLNLKPLSPGKQNLTIKINVANSTVPSSGTLSKDLLSTTVKSSSLNAKTPVIAKPCKVLKSKPAGTSYIKINKHLISPKRTIHKTPISIKKTKKKLNTKYKVVNKTPPSTKKAKRKLDTMYKVVNKTQSSVKKTKRKINTKYKVVNKTLTPCSNEKVLNSLSSSVLKENSPIAIEKSDSFLQKLNDSTMDKLEQDLLAISTALTSTPLSSETNISNYKILQGKTNLALGSKKMCGKKSKTRISKYKIVNSDSPRNYTTKKQNFANLKTNFKKVNHSKLSSVNKHLQPVHVLTPLKQGKSVLVKRLFKSKNAIINKNTNPTSYSAKMIKSKYLTWNKRKISSWQKHALYTKVPPHPQKIKGYYSKTKYPSLSNSYKKTATLAYPKLVRKFPRYGYDEQFSKNASGNKYKRKLKSGFMHSPVVFIHGMRYARNSSGKTLKKLPTKGQTFKTSRRIVIGGKAFIRTNENLMKISPTSSNVASRVLHRSINRIISTSAKKSLTKVNTYCMFYNRFGRCNNGVKCTYIHDPSKIAVCTRFLRGTCKIEGCPFSHEISPGKMAICSFFLVGACEKENCPYRHEKLLPDAELCKAFVQGYCPDGKGCKKAHILICPKYIQGDCDKGNSCAYPHPPKKVKKNVQKEEECEEKKPEDNLLEKVSRYFLQTEDCLSPKSTINQFVPKRRRPLEEQPSFIPLSNIPVVSNSSIKNCEYDIHFQDLREDL